MEIEKIESPVDIFGPALEIVQSYVESVIALENPSVEFTNSIDDFDLFEQLALHIVDPFFQEEAPEGVFDVMLAGIGFAYAEVLANELKLEWCFVNQAFGLRKADSSQVVHPIDMVTKRLHSGETEFWKPVFNFVSEQLCSE